MLRKITKEDAKILFDWRNDPGTRANSINTDEVRWDDHLKWTEKSFSNPDRIVFIYEENGNPAGTCRIDRKINKSGEVFELSWTIAPLWRGKGIGKKMLMELLERAELQGKDLKAVIKPDNIPSIKMAEAFGFKLETEKNGLMEWFRRPD